MITVDCKIHCCIENQHLQFDRIQGAGQPGPIMAWTPILSGAIEPSDNESVESGSASPSGGAGGHSPLITNPPRPQMPSEQQVTAAINCNCMVCTFKDHLLLRHNS